MSIAHYKYFASAMCHNLFKIFYILYCPKSNIKIPRFGKGLNVRGFFKKEAPARSIVELNFYF